MVAVLSPIDVVYIWLAALFGASIAGSIAHRRR